MRKVVEHDASNIFDIGIMHFALGVMEIDPWKVKIHDFLAFSYIKWLICKFQYATWSNMQISWFFCLYKCVFETLKNNPQFAFSVWTDFTFVKLFAKRKEMKRKVVELDASVTTFRNFVCLYFHTIFDKSSNLAIHPFSSIVFFQLSMDVKFILIAFLVIVIVEKILSIALFYHSLPLLFDVWHRNMILFILIFFSKMLNQEESNQTPKNKGGRPKKKRNSGMFQRKNVDEGKFFLSIRRQGGERFLPPGT